MELRALSHRAKNATLFLRFLDLLKAFKECADSGQKLGIDTVHPSPEGHRCAAHATAQFLKEALPVWRRSGNMPRAPSP